MYLFTKIFGAFYLFATAFFLLVRFVAGPTEAASNAFLVGVGSVLTLIAFLLLWLPREFFKRIFDSIPLRGGAKYVFTGWFIGVFVFELVFFFYRVMRGDGKDFFSEHVLPSTLFYLMFFGLWWLFLSKNDFSLEKQFFLFGLTGVFMEQAVLGYGAGLLGAGVLAIPLFALSATLNIANYGFMIVLASYFCQGEFKQGLPLPSVKEMAIATLLPSLGALLIGLVMGAPIRKALLGF